MVYKMRKWLIILAMMLISITAYSQSVVREGNVFKPSTTSPVPTEADKGTLTKYVYVDKNGVSHPVYLSKTGKAFIYYTNKNGEKKKRYMPEIGKQINPSAYK